MFGLNRFFGVRAPYEQHASDFGGGAGDPDPGYTPDPNPSDPGTGSPSGGDPAGAAGASQTPPVGLTDEQRRDLEDYNRIRQEHGGRLPSREELDRLRQVARAALGEQPEGAPRDPRLDRVREGLLKAFPELQDMLELAKRRQDIDGMLERRPELDAVTSAQWQRLAESTRDSLVSQFATAMLGAGKTAADVSDAQRKELVQDFGAWLKAGGPDRVNRYERGDSALVGEFLNRARSLWAPVQREAIAGTVARMPSAPSEGPSGGAPAGNRPGAAAPQSNDDRMDSAVDRAFDFVTNAQR